MAQPLRYVVALSFAATRHGLAYFHAADGHYLTESRKAACWPQHLTHLPTPSTHPSMLIATHRMGSFHTPLARLARRTLGSMEDLTMSRVALRSSSAVAIQRPEVVRSSSELDHNKLNFEHSIGRDHGCRPGLPPRALRCVAAAAGLLRQITGLVLASHRYLFRFDCVSGRLRRRLSEEATSFDAPAPAARSYLLGQFAPLSLGP